MWCSQWSEGVFGSSIAIVICLVFVNELILQACSTVDELRTVFLILVRLEADVFHLCHGDLTS